MAYNQSGGFNPTRRALRRNIRAQVATCVVHTGLDTSTTGVTFFVNNTQGVLQVRKITCRLDIDNGGALTMQPRKAASGADIGGGTALTSDTWDLDAAGSLDTNVDLTLSTTKGVLSIPPGTAIGADFSGDVTAASGSISVDLIPA